jgi:hypothetical protein
MGVLTRYWTLTAPPGRRQPFVKSHGVAKDRFLTRKMSYRVALSGTMLVHGSPRAPIFPWTWRNRTTCASFLTNVHVRFLSRNAHSRKTPLVRPPEFLELGPARWQSVSPPMAAVRVTGACRPALTRLEEGR